MCSSDLGGIRLGVAEDVWVTPDELRVHRARNGLEVALALLLEEQGEEVRLKEQVAQLVEELDRIARVRRVRDLVGLLDGVRDDRAGRLFPIPGAVPAQAPGQLLELEKRLGERPFVRSIARLSQRWRSSPSRRPAAQSRPRRRPSS